MTRNVRPGSWCKSTTEDRQFGVSERDAIDNKRERIGRRLSELMRDQLCDGQPVVGRIANAINSRLKSFFTRYLDSLA